MVGCFPLGVSRLPISALFTVLALSVSRGLGGFSQGALQPWGEATTKQFVHEAVDAAVELESALAKLRMPQRIIVLHYSPIRDTVAGEPPASFAFLGSSRLEEPLKRYAVTAVLHGHARHGTPEGQTTGGVPVYNVAVPLLHKTYPARRFAW